MLSQSAGRVTLMVPLCTTLPRIFSSDRWRWMPCSCSRAGKPPPEGATVTWLTCGERWGCAFVCGQAVAIR